MSAICPVCKQSIQIGVPHGGDGSASVYFRHKWRGQRCDGSRRMVAAQPEEEK